MSKSPRQVFVIALSLVLSFGTLGSVTSASAIGGPATLTSDGFRYMDDGTKVFILGCDGTCPSELIIPETLTATGDHPVSIITESAFQEKSITSFWQEEQNFPISVGVIASQFSWQGVGMLICKSFFFMNVKSL